MTESGGLGRDEMPDMERTKEHILAAGRELMLAADGALRFCKAYASGVKSPGPRSQLQEFFTKAISVADELAKGLITASGKEAAKKAVNPIFEALGHEMEKESCCGKRNVKRAARKKKAPTKKKKVAKRTAKKSRAKRKKPGR